MSNHHPNPETVIYRREDNNHEEDKKETPKETAASSETVRDASATSAANEIPPGETPAAQPSKTKKTGAKETSSSSGPAGERIMWQGRTNPKNIIGLVTVLISLCILATIVGIFAILPALEEDEYIFIDVGLGLVWAGSFLCIFYNFYCDLLATRFLVTKERIFLYAGLLTQRIDEIEMIVVRDIRTKQSFWQRIFKIGDIIIYSGDDTHPELRMQGIKDFYQVKELVRKLSHDIKIERKILFSQSIG